MKSTSNWYGLQCEEHENLNERIARDLSRLLAHRSAMRNSNSSRGDWVQRKQWGESDMQGTRLPYVNLHVYR